MKNLMNLVVLSAVLAVVGCVKVNDVNVGRDEAVGGSGSMRVTVCHDSPAVRSIADYQRLLTEESAVHKVNVLVFDRQSERLEQSATMTSLSEECTFDLPVGEKLVYAIVNGPDLSRVQNVDELLALTTDLSLVNISQHGFAMSGSQVCQVSSDIVAKPEIVVRRQVARVELRSVKCNVAAQYGGMTVDCAFLANAYSVQTLSGGVSSMVNIGGYADQQKLNPIGLNGIEGSCPEHMYRDLDVMLALNESLSDPVYMYCQPNAGAEYTCMYLLATIGGEKYYYRVPFDKGMEANTSYIVDAVITNLGAHLPPDGDIQKGEIQATITIEDWTVGDQYHAEF